MHTYTPVIFNAGSDKGQYCRKSLSVSSSDTFLSLETIFNINKRIG